MIQEEKHLRIVLLTEAHLDVVRNFQQWMKIAKLSQPDDEITVKMLMALGADVNGFPESKSVHGHGRFAGIEILGIGRQDLARPGFDDVAPEPCGMKMTGWKCAFEREMIFFSWRKLIELDDLQAEQVG